MTYAPRATCSGHEAIVSAIKYNSDGSFIASSSADRTARVWSAGSSEPGVLKQTCSGHEHGISDVCWHPHQPYIATASDDKSLGLWDLESGARIRSFHGHTHFVFCCKFHNLGSILVRPRAHASPCARAAVSHSQRRSQRLRTTVALLSEAGCIRRRMRAHERARAGERRARRERTILGRPQRALHQGNPRPFRPHHSAGPHAVRPPLPICACGSALTILRRSAGRFRSENCPPYAHARGAAHVLRSSLSYARVADLVAAERTS